MSDPTSTHGTILRDGCHIPGGRSVVIAAMAFLTLVDLFATQAILPALTSAYGVSPARMSLAVNACTIGMAVAGLAISLAGLRIDRRRAVALCLAGLAVPTFGLAATRDLTVFTALRVLQGLMMASAFTLSLAYIAEHFRREEVPSLFAAYIAGNVASNLFGRMLSAALVDHLGVELNFVVFALLNLGGAALVLATFSKERPGLVSARGTSPLVAALDNLRSPELRASATIGFLILFAFIGVYSFVNFELVREPFALSTMDLGLVYLVFLPSIATTLATGHLVRRWGTRATCIGALALAALALPLLVVGDLYAMVAGLVLVAIGTFMAQATATGFVGRLELPHHGAASGAYLASYFLGGIIGTAVIGAIYESYGWSVGVGVIGGALAAAGGLAFLLRSPPTKRSPAVALHS